MDDRLHLVGAQRHAGPGPHEHRRRRVGLRRDEHGVLGQREADGGRLDAVDRADGLGQLALERPLVGLLLLELRGRHRHVVEQRVAAAVGVRRQPGGRDAERRPWVTAFPGASPTRNPSPRARKAEAAGPPTSPEAKADADADADADMGSAIWSLACRR